MTTFSQAVADHDAYLSSLGVEVPNELDLFLYFQLDTQEALKPIIRENEEMGNMEEVDRLKQAAKKAGAYDFWIFTKTQRNGKVANPEASRTVDSPLEREARISALCDFYGAKSKGECEPGKGIDLEISPFEEPEDVNEEF